MNCAMECFTPQGYNGAGRPPKDSALSPPSSFYFSLCRPLPWCLLKNKGTSRKGDQNNDQRTTATFM